MGQSESRGAERHGEDGFNAWVGCPELCLDLASLLLPECGNYAGESQGSCVERGLRIVRREVRLEV